MLRRTSLLLPLAAALALVPASGAHAAKATFSAVLKAERTVKWDHPRTVSSTDCDGEKYYLANGGEEATIESKPFKVTVEKNGRYPARWTFDKGKNPHPDQYGPAAKGLDKRWLFERRGNTGGWCGGAEIQKSPPGDCGAKIPEFVLAFHANAGVMTWTANHAPWMENEVLSFYKCTLIVPGGMHQGSFPRLEAKYVQADIFNRRKPTVKIGEEKTYGPDQLQVTDSGVKRTTSGSFKWKLVMTRTKK